MRLAHSGGRGNGPDGGSLEPPRTARKEGAAPC